MQADICVAGAGPAGCLVALGLARLGHRVVVLAPVRVLDACEGVSERVLGALESAGLHKARTCLGDAVPRSVTWNGEQQQAANRERLLQRRLFDAALVEDLCAAGIELRRTRLRAVETGAEGLSLALEDGTRLGARLLVDARGRAAARGRGMVLRGPQTLCLQQRWLGPAQEAASAVFACADGWVWLARDATGQRWAQLSVAADNPELPARAGLAAWLQQRLTALPQAAAWLAGSSARGAPRARASTAILQAPLARPEGILRVGDAAMAVDPLSGNGIFQSLSSASVAPAVINTWLREPAQAGLAQRFYDERVRHVFMRFARIGRDFHRTETRWAEQPFWRERAAWPDQEPAHGAPARVLGLGLRPVVDEGFVREREVVLTADQPLGVWRVAGIEIAPLLRGLPSTGMDRAEALGQRIAEATRFDATAGRAVHAWCQQHDLLENTPVV